MKTKKPLKDYILEIVLIIVKSIQIQSSFQRIKFLRKSHETIIFHSFLILSSFFKAFYKKVDTTKKLIGINIVYKLLWLTFPLSIVFSLYNFLIRFLSQSQLRRSIECAFLKTVKSLYHDTQYGQYGDYLSSLFLNHINYIYIYIFLLNN